MPTRMALAVTCLMAALTIVARAQPGQAANDTRDSERLQKEVLAPLQMTASTLLYDGLARRVGSASRACRSPFKVRISSGTDLS